jgi:hypothetical protein
MIPNINKFLPVAIFKMAATMPHKFNIVRFSTSWIDSWHWKISTGRHFQIGWHNITKIQGSF